MNNKTQIYNYLQLMRLHNFGRVYKYQVFFLILTISLIGFENIKLIENLLIIIPYILMSIAGYIHNNISDHKTDSSKKNPLVNNAISINKAYILSLFFLTLSLFFAYYINIFFFHLIYILLWFFYNQKICNFRFKESVFGPFFASLILISYYPLILLIKNDLFVYNYIIFIILLLYGVSGEIGHTIKDKKLDLKKNVKTFSILVPKKYATLIAIISFYVSFFLLITYVFSNKNAFYVIIMTLLIMLFNMLKPNLKVFNYDLFRLFVCIALSFICIKLYFFLDINIWFKLFVEAFVLFLYYKLDTI